VILNGHEYVACQARKAGIVFTKEGNCFTTISDAAGLAKIADTLSEHRAIGRLSQVCERWIYTCVCFALDFDEQKRSGFIRPDVLAVDMADAQAMPPCNIDRVGAGKGQMPCVEQQTDAAAGRRHQTVDFVRGLDDRPHVVVIGQADTSLR